jgi:hypothetical protein
MRRAGTQGAVVASWVGPWSGIGKVAAALWLAGLPALLNGGQNGLGRHISLSEGEWPPLGVLPGCPPADGEQPDIAEPEVVWAVRDGLDADGVSDSGAGALGLCRSGRGACPLAVFVLPPAKVVEHFGKDGIEHEAGCGVERHPHDVPRVPWHLLGNEVPQDLLPLLTAERRREEANVIPCDFKDPQIWAPLARLAAAVHFTSCSIVEKIYNRIACGAGGF